MVLIEDMQSKVELSEKIRKLIEDVVEQSLRVENFTLPVEVSILIADNEGIKKINREHRNIDRETDVLAFPMLDFGDNHEFESYDADYDLDCDQLVLGDIVVSLEKAVEQSVEYQHSLEREISFLTAHAMFHLLGYDHETGENEKAMREKEEAVLEGLGLKR